MVDQTVYNYIKNNSKYPAAEVKKKVLSGGYSEQEYKEAFDLWFNKASEKGNEIALEGGYLQKDLNFF